MNTVVQTSLTGRIWQWPSPPPAELEHPSGMPSWARRLLAARGIETPEAIERYLAPSLAELPEPLLMADMEQAVARLLDAITRREPITIYGDYDVDGVSATTVLVGFLRRVGATVTYYIPDRRAEGYGLNAAAITELAQTTKLLVTADCGITAVDELAHARALGLDVIVVDHHTVPATLPVAHALLNPLRADCAFPFKSLCAAGVAFMLVVALRRALRERGAFGAAAEPDVREHLDLVALATVADMVPMVGLNRVLVATGLRRMASRGRLGLAALADVAKVDLARATAADVGYRLGPRINARGRMGHAAGAVELLLTADAKLAASLAQALDTANQDRRALEREVVELAARQVEGATWRDAAAYVVADPNWHPGVLGLVATRLVSRFRRPVVAVGEGGKGSGRSVEGVELFDAIAQASAHLVRFGGHAAAAGVTVAPEMLEAFREAFASAVAERMGAGPYVPTVKIEAALDEDVVGLDMVREIERLSPFGQQNPEPLFATRNLRVGSARVVGEEHLKLTLGESKLDAIGFGLGHLARALPERLDVVYRVERNVFRGRETVQLRIEDLAASR